MLRSRSRGIAMFVVLLLMAAACARPGAPGATPEATTTTAAQTTTTAGEEELPEGEEIRIGIVAPITGSLAELGQQMVNSAELAVNQLNEAGGVVIDGVRHRVRLVVGDDEGLVVERAVSATRRLIEQERVHALIGLPISSNVLAVIPILQEDGVPYVNPVGKSTEIPRQIAEGQMDFIFQVSPTNDELVAAHGEFIAKHVQPGRVLFLLLNTDAARDYGERADARWPEMMPGLETQTIFVEPDTLDLQAEILRIRQFAPDLVYVLFVGSIVFTWVEQAHATGLGSEMVIFGDSDYAAPDFPERTCGRTDLQLANAVTVKAPITDLTVPFFDGYESAYGSPPPYYAVQTMDGILFLFEALRRLEAWSGDLADDRRAIQQSLASIDEDDPLTGVRGLQWFLPLEEGRKVQADIAITQFQDCEHVLVWPEGPAAGEFIDPRSGD